MIFTLMFLKALLTVGIIPMCKGKGKGLCNKALLLNPADLETKAKMRALVKGRVTRFIAK